MRYAAAVLFLAGCATRANQPAPIATAVAALTPPPAPPADPPPSDPPGEPILLSPEALGDRCRVVAVEGEDGKPRADLVRVDCEPPPGTPGADCLAGAVFAASAEGVARDKIWFVYRVSPADQVPAGQFRIAVLYFESAEAYERGRAGNSDASYVFTTAPEVMPAEAFLMQRSHVANRPAPAPTKDPFDPAAEDDDGGNDD